LAFLAKQLSRVFLFIFRPLNYLWRPIIKIVILPIYQKVFLIQKKVSDKSAGKLYSLPTIILTTHYLPIIVIITIFFSVLINNFLIKNVAAEDLGTESLLYQLAKGDEFEELIEESNTPLIKIEQVNPNQITTDSLQKNELLATAITDININNSPPPEGLLAESIRSGSALIENIASEKQEVQTYLVTAGDTLFSIAQKFKISLNTILWANNLNERSTIRPGDKLTILPTSGVLHKIKKGDTLSALAKKYNVTLDKILNYNNLISDEQLSINQLIIVPGGSIKPVYSTPPGSIANVLRPSSSERRQGGFIWPTVSRHITQYYRWGHSAIDIGGKLNSPIYASAGGKITHAGWGTGYGNYIIIDHGNGQKTLYGHMTKLYVKVGDTVAQGETIGGLGSTGWSTGPHLHFEIIINGKKVNPLSYL